MLKAELTTGASLPERIEEIKKHIQQKFSPNNTSNIQPFITHYLKCWGMLEGDEDACEQKAVHALPWHDWYDSDRP